MLGPGDTFDRYAIEALLGEGGMGQVYRARDTRLGRRVALKVLKPSDDGTLGAARLMREARAAASFEHPNAVAVFDVGEWEGTPFLSMEYIEGRTFKEIIGDASVSVADRVRWLADVARTLAAAHARGLVHRDIKPANVMVRTDGAVKVVDFGIARTAKAVRVEGSVAPEGGLSTLTEAGTVVGTAAYMAPEQMLTQSIDGLVDQFSWGVTAFELLTGKLPWHSPEQAYKIVAEILGPDPVASLRGREGISADVAAIVDRALEKKAAARHASMGAIATALDALAKPASVAPIAATMTERPQRWRLVVVLAIAVAIVAAAAWRARGDAKASSVPATGESSAAP